jgi:hypothetical protein
MAETNMAERHIDRSDVEYALSHPNNTAIKGKTEEVRSTLPSGRTIIVRKEIGSRPPRVVSVIVIERT